MFIILRLILMLLLLLLFIFLVLVGHRFVHGVGGGRGRLLALVSLVALLLRLLARDTRVLVQLLDREAALAVQSEVEVVDRHERWAVRDGDAGPGRKDD